MATSIDLIREFTNKNKVEVNGNLIRNMIESLLTKTNNQKMREENIGKYIESTYPQLAEEFERKRAIAMLYSPDTASKTTSFEFFNEYINIISTISQETSNRLMAEMNAQKEQLKKDVENAQKKYEDEQKALDTAVSNYKARHNGSTDGIDEIGDYKKLKDNAEIAKIKLEKARQKQNEGVGLITPLDQPKAYFGMTSKTVKDMLDNQVKTCTYMELRREQIETLGIRSNNYVLEIENAQIPESVTYKNANAEQRRKLQEIHATKQIMQEKLDSRTTGAFAWFKRWWYRKDIAALNNFMNTANRTLTNAKFTEQDAAEAIDIMTNKGFFHEEYMASGAEKVFEETLISKLPESEVAAVSKMSPEDQLLQMGFRPSEKYETFQKQMDAYRKIKDHIEKNEERIPRDVITVFQRNSKKLREAHNIYKNPSRHSELSNIYKVCETIENELMNRVSHDEYKPVTFAKLVEDTSIKQNIKIDAKDLGNEKNVEVSQRVDDNPVKKHNDIVIGND